MTVVKKWRQLSKKRLSQEWATKEKWSYIANFSVVQGVKDRGADIINKSNTSSRNKARLSLNPWGLYPSEKFTFSPATINNQNVPQTITYNAMLKCIPQDIRLISYNRFG